MLFLTTLNQKVTMLAILNISLLSSPWKTSSKHSFLISNNNLSFSINNVLDYYFRNKPWHRLFLQVIQDAAIPKKTKSLFFNTYVLKQISQLLTTPIDHTHQDGTAELHEYVFGFLLKLCTNFQLGICYKCKERPEGLQKWVHACTCIRNYIRGL